MLDIDLKHPRPAEARRGEPAAGRTDEDGREPVADASEHRLFALAVAPWLTPATRAVEIGPGGGKWTVRLAPLVAELVVVDVADIMIERTRARMQAAGLTNVSFVLGTGHDLAPLPSDRFDLVFGYDVFVHIPLEATVAYVGDIARVLREGGVAVLHHAVNDVGLAWDHIESHGPYHFHSRDALDRMYGRFGLRIESVWTGDCTTVVTARKPADSVVPRLEQALRLAASAGDARALDEAARAITGIARDLTDRVTTLATALSATAPGPERYEVIQQIRRLVRG
jgi:ubiquinone/menaquinone biosynthesis C-methylase UbiE